MKVDGTPYRTIWVAKDGKSVIWKLKPGVLWHDGQPLTPEDVIFTWEYVSDPAATATTRGVRSIA